MRKHSLDTASQYSDEELVALINKCEYAYFQLLIDRYMPYIISLASRYSAGGLDTDDFIQEGVVAIFSAVKAFDGEKASFKTFVKLCIKRAMYSAVLRTAGLTKHVPDDLILPIDDVCVADANSPETILIAKESYTDLENNIKEQLSNLEYQVLSEFLMGKSYAQIADTLSVSIKTVDNALKRIRQKIKQ